MAMCLAGFYYSNFEPNKRNTLAMMKALLVYERDPCHCPQCAQLQISLGAILNPYLVPKLLPGQSPDYH